MSAAQILFGLMSFIALASAVYVAASNNLVRSVFMFFVTLFALAGLYVLALADFVAVTQIVIYVGGILVLILFVFMLSGRETLEAMQHQPKRLWKLANLPAFLICALLLIVLFNLFMNTNADALPWIKQAVHNNDVIKAENTMTENIGINLMTRYLLPFEVISILLLMALAGAAHLSRKEAGA
ncbi:NADH-quinone oxidoreductase subunit J [Mucilaginibacter sp. RS28]|uniref:NADH-quinone oxidoreductase subunit J n=1 Tax=Mucilaginibacter straminoryzae TaxID=2932774 RepID=A0A9X1X4C4_9SPHI|nr:NADH-quinone oxidoreductase subunit J [Mucilaginibacter straminoryzae]MCJ8210140.1 NADH-quinone oxidoreductase subunit J [Mucilaginibacter straminoryzae]